MKKQILIPLCTVIGVAVIGGSTFGIMKYRNSKIVVDVLPVSYISTNWWGDQSSSDGLITSNVTQEIMPQSDQLIKEVYVKEGDKVSIGDKLLAYDTTLTELDLEAKRISLQSVDLQIKNLNKEIEQIKQGKMPNGSGGTGYNGGLSNDGAGGGDSGGGSLPGLAMNPERALRTSSGMDESEQPQPEPAPEKKLDDTTVLTPSENSLYEVRCDKNTIITKAFIQKIREKDADGKNIVVMLIFTDTGDRKLLDGQSLKEPSENAVETNIMDFINHNFELNSEDPDNPNPDPEPEPTPEPEPNPEPEPPIVDPGGDPNGGGIDNIPLTKEEITKLVNERQQQINKLNIQRKQAELDMKKLQATLDDSTILSSVNGIVKTCGNPEEGAEEGKPFLVVDSSEGLYLTGTISELQLETVKVGQVVTAMSWTSGQTVEATITEISPYPNTSGYNYSENPNVSFYPYKAYIENTEGFSNNENVQISMTSGADPNGGDMDKIYIQKPFIREEDGKSYVYIRGEDNKLKRQQVDTGKTIYGSYVEIKSGVTNADYIAFPYGKNVKDGVNTKEGDPESFYY